MIPPSEASANLQHGAPLAGENAQAEASHVDNQRLLVPLDPGLLCEPAFVLGVCGQLLALEAQHPLSARRGRSGMRATSHASGMCVMDASMETRVHQWSKIQSCIAVWLIQERVEQG